MKKINMNMGDDLVLWFEEKAKEIGITRTALMSIAMNEYREQRENMKALANVQVFVDKIIELDKESKGVADVE